MAILIDAFETFGQARAFAAKTPGASGPIWSKNDANGRHAWVVIYRDGKGPGPAPQPQPREHKQ